jgi:large subunit ribosomal protein L4
MNRKAKRAALYNALSSKMASEEIVVVDAIATESYKTKAMVNMLSAVGAGKKALVVLDTVDEKVIKSFANIPGVKTVQANQLNVYDILNCNTFVMTKAAATMIEEVYGE